LSQERLVRDAVAIFAGCFPGLEIEDVKVNFVSVSQESPLKEILATAVVLGFQTDLEKEVPDLIRQLTGTDVPDRYDTMVTVFVLIAAIYGASYLRQRFSRRGEAKELPSEYERLINVAGDYIHVTPDTVEESVEKHLGRGRKRATARAARDFFSPAQRHRARSIKSGGDLEIPKNVIDEIPTDVDIAAFDTETDSYPLEDTAILFEAHDRCRHKTGWAAIVPAVSAARKIMHIDPSVNVDELFTKRQIRGDVIVFSEADDDGEYQPKLYYLQGVNLDDDAS